MTHLDKLMLEELQRRNYSQTTVNAYLKMIEEFAKHFNKNLDELGVDEIRSYQVHLLKERKLGAHSRPSYGSVAFLLLQDIEAKLSRRGSAISEGAAALAQYPHARRSSAPY